MSYEDEMRALQNLMDEEDTKTMQGVDQMKQNARAGFNLGRPRTAGPASIALGYKPVDLTQPAMEMKTAGDELAIKNNLTNRNNLLNQYRALKKAKETQDIMSRKEKIDADKFAQQGKWKDRDYALALERLKAMKQKEGRALNKIVPETTVGKISDFDRAVRDLSSLGEKVSKNTASVGPIAGFQKFNPYAVETRQLQSDIDRVKQIVGKALEGGVLRKEDEEKYNRILATIRDEPKVAMYKLNEILEDIGKNRTEYITNMGKAGYNVSGFESATPIKKTELGKNKSMASAIDKGVSNIIPNANAATLEDSEAIKWAKANPNDPRAVKILKVNGVE